jgi:hypothetical protein
MLPNVLLYIISDSLETLKSNYNILSIVSTWIWFWKIYVLLLFDTSQLYMIVNYQKNYYILLNQWFYWLYISIILPKCPFLLINSMLLEHSTNMNRQQNYKKKCKISIVDIVNYFKNNVLENILPVVYFLRRYYL